MVSIISNTWANEELCSGPRTNVQSTPPYTIFIRI